MAEILVAVDGPIATPYKYVVPPTSPVEPSVVNATFDGSAAAGVFLPCCSIYSQDGRLLSRTFPEGVQVAVGDTAEVTYSPFAVGLGSGSSSGSGAAFSGGVVGQVTKVGAGTGRTDSNGAGGGDLQAFVTYPAGLAAGDVVIAVLDTYINGSPFGDISLPAPPAGWGLVTSTFRAAQDDGGAAGIKTTRAIAYHVCTGTEGTVSAPFVFHSANGSGIRCDTVAVAFRGVKPSGSGIFFQTQTFLTGGSPMTVTSPAVGNVLPGSAALYIVTCPAIPGGGAWGFPAGFTNTAQAGASGGAATIISDSEPVTALSSFAWTYTGSGSIGAFHRFCEVTSFVLYPTVT